EPGHRPEVEAAPSGLVEAVGGGESHTFVVVAPRGARTLAVAVGLQEIRVGRAVRCRPVDVEVGVVQATGVEVVRVTRLLGDVARQLDVEVVGETVPQEGRVRVVILLEGIGRGRDGEAIGGTAEIRIRLGRVEHPRRRVDRVVHRPVVQVEVRRARRAWTAADTGAGVLRSRDRAHRVGEVANVRIPLVRDINVLWARIAAETLHTLRIIRRAG